MSTTNLRLYILKIFNYKGYALQEPLILFHSSIMSTITHTIEVWAWAYDGKYLSEMDEFCKRVWKNVYTDERIFIRDETQFRGRQPYENLC